MKVKVRDKMYDGAKEPVIVILTKEDKENILAMPADCMLYCSYPETTSEEEATKAFYATWKKWYKDCR